MMATTTSGLSTTRLKEDKMKILVLTLILYLFGAFVGWSFNPVTWATEGRLMLGVLWLLGAFGAVSVD